ncbi:MAG: tetratricopeptide repeat protein [Desulfobacterales bacterium]|jgi:tetratricopeptide (TPR) repeat protein
MAKKQKKTRKELLREPDEFITITGKLIGFAVDHKNQLIYALGIIVALALIFSGYRFFSIRSENNASALLHQSLLKYNDLKTEKKPDEIYSTVSEDFKFILTKYKGKESAKLARLIYANICYNAGKYKPAIELYKKALLDFNKNPMIHSQILSNLGYAYEQEKEYSTAVGYFEKIVSAPKPVMRDEALYHLGRLYEKLGEKEKSREAYNKILTDHQDFIYIDLVKEQLLG